MNIILTSVIGGATRFLAETAASVTEAVKENGGKVDVFSPDAIAGYFSTAIVTIIGLLITVFILKKLLYKPILKVIHDRQNKVDDLLKDAEDRHRSSVEEQQRLDQAMSSAKDEASAFMTSAKTQAENQRDAIIADAKAEANAILAKAERERQAMIASDEERIYNEAVNIAVQAIGHFASESYTGEQEWKKVKSVISDYVKQEQAEATAEQSE